MDYDRDRAIKEFDEKVVTWLGGFLIGAATAVLGLIIWSFFI